ncbi:MAG: isopenicillin-N N-acyltransferase like protein [Actinomycetota bacterium]|jgi:isopenicillin-N N-acyltransferase-like protein|nr:isopenicillin-N N-acyltransferase like protein [Actinomycetota bacterium]
MIPHVRVRGDARSRGRQYGEQVAGQVRGSLDAYAEIFGHYAGWDWPTVVEHARTFLAPVAAFDERYLEEMRGIAEGADVPFEDILAINVRTEVMFAAKARSAVATLPRVGECTSFAIVPPPASERPVLVGQNWDWTLHARDTVVVLEAEQDEAPAYVTVVEAGLLAKTGFNSSGVAIATNALVSDRDTGTPGVPYHVLLRAMLDATSPSEALGTLQRAPRSSSANYVIGHRSGLGIIVEAAPGDFSQLRLIQPDERGVLLHGNHFEHPGFDAVDVGIWLMPDSPFRMQRTRATLRAERSDPTPKSLLEMLSDHAGEPAGVCCHPAESAHRLEQFTTVISTVMDLEAETMLLVHGSPCSTPPTELLYQGFFAGARERRVS